MAYDYRALLENVKTVLGATSTIAILTASMTVDHPITSDNIHNRINLGNPRNLPGFASEYPRVYCHLVSKTEEYSELGVKSLGSGSVDIKRDVVTNIFLYAFVYKQDNSDASDKQAQIFARNIETIFRSNTQVSGDNGWDSLLFPNVEFANAYIEGDSDDTHLSAVRLEGEFKKFAIS